MEFNTWKPERRNPPDLPIQKVRETGFDLEEDVFGEM
jgi:hypothetical protein